MSAAIPYTIAAGETAHLPDAEIDALAGMPPDEVDRAGYREAWLVHHGLERHDGGCRLTSRYALQSAIVITLAMVAVGTVTRPLYGLVALLFCAGGVALLGLAFGPVSRAAARLRIPRGRLLGMLVLAPAVLVTAVVVQLLRVHYRDVASSASAAGLMRDARVAADGGYTDHALSLLQQAEQIDPSVPGTATLRLRLERQQGADHEVVLLKRQVAKLQAGTGG